MKKFISLLTIILIAFIGVTIKINKKEASQLLIETFSQSDFQTVQSNINTYAVLNETINTFEDMEKYLKALENKIGSNYSCETSKSETEKSKTVKQIYISQNAKFTIQLETINSKDIKTYLIMDVILYDYNENIIDIKQNLDIIFKDLNLKSSTNISMTGTYDGDMSYEEKKTKSFEIMNKMNAKVKEDYVTDKVYSIVGYTKQIDEYIYSQKQKININLALRYNEYENKTYLYLATPVITIEY